MSRCEEPSVGGLLADVTFSSLSLELVRGTGPGKPRLAYGGGTIAPKGGRGPEEKPRGGSPRGPKNSGGMSRGGGSGPMGGRSRIIGPRAKGGGTGPNGPIGGGGP